MDYLSSSDMLMELFSMLASIFPNLLAETNILKLMWLSKWPQALHEHGYFGHNNEKIVLKPRTFEGQNYNIYSLSIALKIVIFYLSVTLLVYFRQEY